MELGGVPIDVSSQPYEFWALCLGLVVAYNTAIRRFGPAMAGRPDVPPVTMRQRVSFHLGVLALLLVSGTPWHAVGEQALFWFHMTEHMVHAFIVAPLLLLGTPGWLFRLALQFKPVRWLATNVGKPLIATIVFNVAMALLHWPTVVDFMITSTQFHGVSHMLWLVASLIMWLPVLSPDEALVPRLPELGRMGYLFVQSLLPTVPSAFLTFGDSPIYQRYTEFPRAWDLSAVHDMQIAGLIMKVGVGFLLWGIIATTFFRWASAEERRERRDRLAASPAAPDPDLTPTA